MRIPLSWLWEFLEPSDFEPQRIAQELTLKSVEASVYVWDYELDGVVFAKVVEAKAHPKRNNLMVYTLQVGQEVYITVVSADKSLKVGDGVFCALPNARVGSMCITKREFDGVVSEGMLLSAKELGLEEGSEEVLKVDEEFKVGTSAYELLGFGEHILEIEPTPNRGDLLSVRGLARELSALLGLKKKEKVYPDYKDFSDIDIRIESYDCLRYRGAVIEGLEVKRSPLWLRRRLWQCGIRSINNIVDITNYVMLQEGQPLHAFDLERIELPVFVRDAKEGERIRTLTGTERELSPANLIIADAKGPIAVAGVVGSIDSAVIQSTKSILLESAYFNPYRVRKSAKALATQTESSYRFERSVDIEGVKRAQDLAIELILRLAGGELRAVKDLYPQPYKPKRIFLSLEKYRRYSGEDFDRSFVERALTALEIPHRLLRCGVEVDVPSYRSFDISRDVDIIEELLRIRGYQSLTSEVLHLPSRPFGFIKLEDKIRELLKARGFNEVITFSFEGQEIYDKLALDKPSLEILNPLVKSERFLRTSLLPSLLKVCIENQRRHNYSMAIFEIGKVFLEEERSHLAFLMTGYKSIYPEEEYGPYHGLSVVHDLLNLYAEGWESEKSRLAFLHPNIQRLFKLNGQEIGFFGMLHPRLQKELELKYGVFVCEIDLGLLKERKRSYKPVSTYPPVVRDITLVMDKEVDVNKLIKHIKGKSMVEDVKVFSVYTDDRLGEGKKSVSFRVVFRSMSSTLSDTEVNRLVKNLVEELERLFSARLR